MISAFKPKVAKTGRSAGQKWAVLEFEDLEGKVEGMCFADVFETIAKEDQQRGRAEPAIKPERIVFVRAKVDKRRETPCLVVTDLIPIEEATSRLTTAIKLTLDAQRHTPEMLVSLKPIFERHKGGCDVYAQLVVGGRHEVTKVRRHEVPEEDAVDADAGEPASAGGENGHPHSSSSDSGPSCLLASVPPCLPKKLTLRFGPDLRVCPGPDFARDIEHILGPGTLDLVGDGLKRKKRLEQQKLFAADQAPEEVAVEAAGITDAIDPEED